MSAESIIRSSLAVDEPRPRSRSTRPGFEESQAAPRKPSPSVVNEPATENGTTLVWGETLEPLDVKDMTTQRRGEESGIEQSETRSSRRDLGKGMSRRCLDDRSVFTQGGEKTPQAMTSPPWVFVGRILEPT